LRKAVTDPQKIRRNDKGHPDICLVFGYHNKFNPTEIPEIRTNCESGALGCVDCKNNCAAKLSEYLAPIRQKRMELESRPNDVRAIIDDGNRRANEVAAKTMAEVHEAMGFG